MARDQSQQFGVCQPTTNEWKSKADDVNALFSNYLESLDSIAPPAREVINAFPVYVGYIALARFLCLYDLYKRVLELPGHVAEVGTFRGASLVFFGKMIRLFEPNSYTQAHGFDWFEGMQPTRSDNLEEAGKWAGDYEMLIKLVSLQGLDDCVVVHKMDVTKALEPFLERHHYMRFKLVFIDCGIRPVLEKALTSLWPRIVPGGILVMDHFGQGVSPSESELLERSIGRQRIEQLPFTRQPTAYVVKKSESES